MPDQSTAATEHAITQDLSALPAAETQQLIATVLGADFPVVLRGYDRDAVDAHIMRTSQLVAELRATRTPESAVRRELERVGEEVAGILRRAHETAGQITAQSRSEADDRLQRAAREAHEITANAKARLRDLDADTDRIWAERDRIIDDARGLADELMQLANAAAERFPPSEEEEVAGEPVRTSAAGARDGEAAESEQLEEAAPDGEPELDDDARLDHDDEELGVEAHSAVLRVSRALNGRS